MVTTAEQDISELHERGQENLTRFVQLQVDLAITMRKMSESHSEPGPSRASSPQHRSGNQNDSSLSRNCWSVHSQSDAPRPPTFMITGTNEDSESGCEQHERVARHDGLNRMVHQDQPSLTRIRHPTVIVVRTVWGETRIPDFTFNSLATCSSSQARFSAAMLSQEQVA